MSITLSEIVASGIVGFTGSQGIAGEFAAIGFTGSQGVQGVTGLTGSVGFTGSVGTTGLTGSQGTQGVTGFTGSQGVQGVTGFTGSIGFTGSVGTTGLTGSQGTQGVTGFTGSQGIQGVTGFTGSIGFTGSVGPTVYPSSGIAVSTGTAWSTSKNVPTGNVVGTTDTQTLTNKTVTDIIIDGRVTEEIFTITGTTPALSPQNGTIQLWTLSNNSSPTYDAQFIEGSSFTLMIDDGTARTITWPTTSWVGGVAPTLATTGYTIITLWRVSSVYYGSYAGAA
jgi:collagen type VII alpha